MTRTAAATAEPDKAAPLANHCRFGIFSDLAGFSISRKVMTAAASDRTTTARRCGQVRA